MPVPKCYADSILFVDLLSDGIKEETLPENIYREYIGGTGLGIRVLFERIKPNGMRYQNWQVFRKSAQRIGDIRAGSGISHEIAVKGVVRCIWTVSISLSQR